jgi:hypothetical protein
MPLGAFRQSQYLANPVEDLVVDWANYDGSKNGATVTLSSLGNSQKSVLLDTDKVLTLYTKSNSISVGTGSTVFGRVLTVSDTTISLGDEFTIFTPSVFNNFDSQNNFLPGNYLVKINSTRAIMLSAMGSNNVSGVFIDINGTNITTTTIPTFTATSGIQIAIPTLLSESRLVFAGRAGTGAAPAGARLLSITPGDVRELSSLNVSPPSAAGLAGFQFPKLVRLSDTRFVLQGLLQQNTTGLTTSITFDAVNDTLSFVRFNDRAFNIATGNAPAFPYDLSSPPGEWTPFGLIQVGNLYTFHNFKYETTGVSTVDGGTGTQAVTIFANPQTSRRSEVSAYPTNDTTMIIGCCDNNNATSRVFDVSVKIFKSGSDGSLIGLDPVTVIGGTLTGSSTTAPASRRDKMTLVPLSENRILFSYTDGWSNGEGVAPIKAMVLKV